MSEAMVKGDLIHKLLGHISNKWGRRGLEMLNTYPENFLIEKWYPISEFSSILSKIDEIHGNSSQTMASRMGY